LPIRSISKSAALLPISSQGWAISVRRDGKVAGVTKTDAPQAELVQLLVGSPLNELYPRRAHSIGDVLLRMRQASFRPYRVS
ncbi:hypothetical protein ACCS53_38895, partial [Rhizobium ruizarguesonis]